MFYELHVKLYNPILDCNETYVGTFDNEFIREDEATMLKEQFDTIEVTYEMIYIDEGWDIDGVQHAWCPECNAFTTVVFMQKEGQAKKGKLAP